MYLVIGAALLGIALLLAVLFVFHPGPLGIDRLILDQLVTTRHGTVTPTVSELSAVLSPAAIIGATVAVGIGLTIYDRSPRRALQILASSGAAALAAAVLKVAVSRPRPPAYVQLGPPEADFSFPSGHVTGTTALCTALVVVLLAGRPARRVALAGLAAAAVVALTLWTRLYLGMHWFSDTVGGVLVGTGVVLIVAPITARLIDRYSPGLTSAYAHLLHRKEDA